MRLGEDALAGAAQTLVAAANKDPDFAGVFTLFSTRSPSIYTDIDREKAEKVGLTPTDVFSTLQVYLGSQYVNDFNYLGRTYQVIAQADGSFRRDANDIGRLKARNTSGDMVPIGTVARLRDETAPYRVPRYNLFPAAEVMGAAAPGIATGTALHRMEAGTEAGQGHILLLGMPDEEHGKYGHGLFAHCRRDLNQSCPSWCSRARSQ
jgi:multidrug efflux pump subunit AcrB